MLLVFLSLTSSVMIRAGEPLLTNPVPPSANTSVEPAKKDKDDPCELYGAACGMDMLNFIIGSLTLGGSGGWGECAIDLGINLPFLISDLWGLFRNRNRRPDIPWIDGPVNAPLLGDVSPSLGGETITSEQQQTSSIILNTTCDIIDCLPVTIPSITPLRVFCSTVIRTTLASMTCWELKSDCETKKISRPASDPDRGVCYRSSVSGWCTTTNDEIRRDCARVAELADYEEPLNTQCLENCIENSISSKVMHCSRMLDEKFNGESRQEPDPLDQPPTVHSPAWIYPQ
jgi:hypothetical protein